MTFNGIKIIDLCKEENAMKCGKVYIDYMKDCCENEGGYYCVVYSDEYETEIDHFCVHPDDCNCKNYEEVEKFIRQYAKMYQ